MKKRILSFLASGLFCWMMITGNLQAQVSFSAGFQITSTADFYQPLGSYGVWVDVPRYGHCWHPAHVDSAWHPYTLGHWEWTDLGWYWVSDEPWGWAVYHYGSWEYDPFYGWIWIPGLEWAPAWVNWRESDDYIGWAPCGPGGVVLGPSFFIFVDVAHFHTHLKRGSYLVNDRRIFDRTHGSSGFRRERRMIDGAQRSVVYNAGPSVSRVERATGTRFNPVPVQRIIQETPGPQHIRREGVQRRPQQPSTTQTPGRLSSPAPQPTPAVPQTRRAPEPTGREQPRYYPERPAQSAPAPAPTAPQRPPEHAPNVPQRPVNPTAHERGHEERPPAAARQERPPQSRHEAPGQQRKDENDRP